MDITSFTGSDLTALYRSLGVEVPADVSIVRVSTSHGGLKVKVNEWTWTPSRGVDEPSS